MPSIESSSLIQKQTAVACSSEPRDNETDNTVLFDVPAVDEDEDEDNDESKSSSSSITDADADADVKQHLRELEHELEVVLVHAEPQQDNDAKQKQSGEEDSVPVLISSPGPYDDSTASSDSLGPTSTSRNTSTSSVLSRPGAIAVVGPRMFSARSSYEYYTNTDDHNNTDNNHNNNNSNNDNTNPPMIIVSATPVEEPIVVDAKPMNPKLRRIFLNGFIVTTVLAIGAIIVLVLTLRPKPKPISPRSKAIQQMVAQLSSPEDIGVLGSPQNRSADWLLGDKNAGFDPEQNKSRMVQRYTLAVLYYSTEGDKWTEQGDFLSLEHECDWHPFINCTTADGVVTGLQLGKCC